MKLIPTEEQEDIKVAVKEHRTVVIDAGAGTGKTSTLAMAAEQLPERSLLLVFNRSAREDAETRFPSHVEVRTTHSLAYSSYGAKYKHKLTRPRGTYVNVAYTGGEISRHFKIKPIPLEDGKWITSAHQGLMVRTTVEKFEQSAETQVLQYHVPKVAKKLGIEEAIYGYAQKLWRQRQDINSKVLISHDTYMKLFQLSKPILSYKVIYLDEAQDTSACTLDIVMRQAGKSKIIVVGDNRQAIYGWRGSVNAMEIVQGKHLRLSKSFRFGPDSSSLANKVLEQEGLESADGLKTVIGSRGTVNRNEQYTVLYRTNSALLMDALVELKNGKSINLEINATDLCKQLTDAQHLYRGNHKKVKHESLLMYTDWSEVKEEGKHNPELMRISKLVEEGQVANVVNVMNSHRNSKTPDITMTTAHKSKGREWNQVVLGNDYPSHYNQEGEWTGLVVPEQNLLYVALTRAKKVLEYNSSIEEIMFKPSPVEMKIAEISNYTEADVRTIFNKLCKQEHKFNAFEDWLHGEREEIDMGNPDDLWDNRWKKGAIGIIDTLDMDEFEIARLL